MARDKVLKKTIVEPICNLGRMGEEFRTRLFPTSFFLFTVLGMREIARQEGLDWGFLSRIAPCVCTAAPFGPSIVQGAGC